MSQNQRNRVTDRFTLQEVNSVLLQQLHDKICQTDNANELVELSGAVAKLNVASKSSEYFAKPITEESLLEDEQDDAFSILEEGQV